jgi:hypothetical protein
MSAVVLWLVMHPLALGQPEVVLPSAETDLPSPEDRLVPPVDAGREALDHWWPRNYPWYDSQTDGVRRVEIPEPWDWSWLWAWLRGLWDWLKGLLPDWDLTWLRDWFSNWNWRSLFRLPTTFWGWTTRIALVLLTALLVYLMVRACRRWQGRSAKSEAESKKAAEQEDADRLEALPFPVRSGRLDLLAEARKHCEQGDYGRAIVYLFGFQLVRLDRQQIIRLTRGKTNRQYLREVGPRRVLRRLVEQTMVAFEDVFFGNHALDRARFEACWSRLDEFESLAAEGAA